MDNFWVFVVSCFVDWGVVVIIFVGNEGFLGLFFVSSGLNGFGVFFVVVINVIGNLNISVFDFCVMLIFAYFIIWGFINEFFFKLDIGVLGYDVISIYID